LAVAAVAVVVDLAALVGVVSVEVEQVVTGNFS